MLVGGVTGQPAAQAVGCSTGLAAGAPNDCIEHAPDRRCICTLWRESNTSPQSGHAGIASKVGRSRVGWGELEVRRDRIIDGRQVGVCRWWWGKSRVKYDDDDRV